MLQTDGRRDIKLEVQHPRLLLITFLRGEEAKPLPRTAVELAGDRGAVPLRDAGERLPVREILAHEPIRVLVGPAFPGVMRRRQVEPSAKRLFDRAIPFELAAIVGRDGVDRVRLVAEQLDRPGSEGLRACLT